MYKPNLIAIVWFCYSRPLVIQMVTTTHSKCTVIQSLYVVSKTLNALSLASCHLGFLRSIDFKTPVVIGVARIKQPTYDLRQRAVVELMEACSGEISWQFFWGGFLVASPAGKYYDMNKKKAYTCNNISKKLYQGFPIRFPSVCSKIAQSKFSK